MTVAAPPPSTPTGEIISLDGSYSISWESTGSGSYTLEEKFNSGSWTVAYTGASTSKSFSGKAVGTYLYRVKGCSSTQTCDWSITSTMYVESATNLYSERSFSSAALAGSLPVSVSADNKGNGVVGIPLRLPPGVNGHAPSLSLTFSSGGSPALTEEARTEGVLGYGWRLSGIPEIRRCRVGLASDPDLNSSGIAYDSTDRLCLNGNELVEVTATDYWADTAEYRTKLQTYAKIEALGSGVGNRYFKVSYRDGSYAYLGSTAETRLVSPGESEPYVWSIRNHTDAFGNVMTYTWHELSTVGTNYLRMIDYGGSRVEFRYQERCESTQNCDHDIVQNTESIPGLQVQAVALNRILTRADGKWVADYRLDNNYVSGRLRLERIQHCGYNDAGSSPKCLAPVTFGWDTLSIAEDVDGGTETSDLLVVDEVTSSYGDTTTLSYQVIEGYGAGSHPLHVAAHSEFPSKPFPSGIGLAGRQRAVVSQLKLPDGNGGTATTQFKYQGYPYYSTLGRGYIGFAGGMIEFRDQGTFDASGTTHYDAYRRQYRQYRLDFPYIGKTAREVTEVDTNPSSGLTWSQIQKRIIRHRQLTFGYGVIAPYRDYVVQNRELTSSGSDGYASAYSTFTTYCKRPVTPTNDCSSTGLISEFPTQIEIETEHGLSIGSADNGLTVWGDTAGIALNGVIKHTSQTTNFDNVASPWNNGFVSQVEQGWGVGSITETEAIEFTRDAANHRQPGEIQYFEGDPDYDRTISLTYNGFGNLVSTDDRGVDQVTSYSTQGSFSHNRYPQTLTNAVGHVSSLVYDLRFGSLESITDANSDTSTISRDELGRITSTTYPDGTKVTVNYQNCSSGCSAVTWATPRLKVTRTTTNGSVTVAPDEVSYFDTRGLLVLTETEAFSATGGWSRVQRHYDAEGKLIKASLPYLSSGGTPNFNEYFYDYKGRTVHIDRANGATMTYDIYADGGSGNLVNIVETETGENRVKRYRYDRLGQLKDTTDAFGNSLAVTASYTYTVRGELDTVTVDGKQVADINYDTARNRLSINEPNSGLTTFDYYSNGLLKQSTDSNSAKTRFQYDALRRKTQQIDGYLGTSPVTNTWQWDTATNGKGMLASRNNGGTFTEAYTYDTHGRADTITATVNVAGFPNTGPYVIDYGYDSEGRLATIAYPNFTYTREYDNRGYLEKEKKGSLLLTEYTDHDAFGNVTGETLGNGLRTSRSYDPATGEINTIKTGTASLPTSIQDLVFEWQTDGSLYRRIDKRGTTSTGDDLVEVNVYDAVGRLKSSATAAASRTLTFGYDDHGNITYKQSNVSSDMDVTSYSYPDANKPHRLETVTINGVSTDLKYYSTGRIHEYDADTGDDTFLRYDNAGRVEGIVVGSSYIDSTPTARDEFWYGPDGQRFLRKASWMDGSTLKTSWTLYLMGGTFQEVHPMHHATVDYRQRVMVNGAVSHRFVKYTSSSTTAIEYLHRDHLGSVTEMTNSSGAVAHETDFDPFGRQRAVGWNRDVNSTELELFADDEDVYLQRGFTDHEMLNRTGFIHMNGRVYDPRLGRFVQPDPIIGRPQLSQNYNRYAYVLNSPLSFTDPSGFDAHCRLCSNKGSPVEFYVFSGGQGDGNGMELNPELSDAQIANMVNTLQSRGIDIGVSNGRAYLGAGMSNSAPGWSGSGGYWSGDTLQVVGSIPTISSDYALLGLRGDPRDFSLLDTAELVSHLADQANEMFDIVKSPRAPKENIVVLEKAFGSFSKYKELTLYQELDNTRMSLSALELGGAASERLEDIVLEVATGGLGRALSSIWSAPFDVERPSYALPNGYSAVFEYNVGCHTASLECGIFHHPTLQFFHWREFAPPFVGGGR